MFYSEPTGFTSGNIQAYLSTGQANVTQSSDAQLGSSSIRLETISVPGDTIAGLATIGTIGGPSGISGGVPYTETPDSLVAYVKYDIMPGDTAILGVGFKNGGLLLGQAIMEFTGTQNTWHRVSAPAQYGTVTVDTMIAIISSSDIDTTGIPGSWLMVDNVQLINATQAFPNQSFESWTDVSVEEPDNWNTLNLFSIFGSQASVTKSTDAHGGTFAARVETVELFGDTVGFLFNGELGEDGPEGGMAVNANPKKLSGFYKYTPVGPDTAYAGLIAYIYNATLDSLVPVDSALTALTASAGYVSFEVNLTYDNWPPIDTLGILFTSSNAIEDTNYNGLGSVLLLDDLSLEYFPASVEEIDNSLPFTVYPNPASDIIYLQYGEVQEDFGFEMYDLLGNLVLNENVTSNGTGSTLPIATDDFANGIYIYKVSVGNKIKTGKIEVVK